ncbi:MAG: thiamine phosphate synthase [Hyphomicrobium sp.]
MSPRIDTPMPSLIMTRCRLVIVAGASPAAVDRLARILATGDPATSHVATVIIEPATDRVFDAEAARAMVRIAQSRDAAALVADDAHLAHSLEADGVHLGWSADIVTRYEQARTHLGAGAIVGADAGCSRHVAMQLGEAGADYVAFGAVEGGMDADGTDIVDAVGTGRLDLVAWWSEIFEPPVMAFAEEGLTEATELAEAGADFVALRLPADDEAAFDLAQWMRAAQAALRRRTSAT